MKRLIACSMGLAVLGMFAVAPAFGRGFGGFHSGGGFAASREGGFGGFHGGAHEFTGPRGGEYEGVHGSAFGGYGRETAGGFHGEQGAYREGGYDRYGGYGGYRGGGEAYGAYRGGEAGTYREGGMGAYGDGYREGGAYGGGAYREGGYGAYREGGGYGAYRGWAGEGGYRGSVPTRQGMNQFLGLPTDAGLHAATRGAVTGYGAAAAGYGFRYVNPRVYQSQALAVRNNFYGHNLFSSNWYTAHPYAWTTSNWWGATGYASSAWTAATWPNLSSWFNYSASPVYYDYGNTITYSDGNVYSDADGAQTMTADAYYQQADDLAGSGSSAPAAGDNDTPWMPLGVFGLVQTDQKEATLVVQLAVNKAGILRGNEYNDVADTTRPVQGAVDKKTQRVAWTAGNNKTTVFDTGLYNLTKDQAPVLVHIGKAKTQQWLMVRMKQSTQSRATNTQ